MVLGRRLRSTEKVEAFSAFGLLVATALLLLHSPVNVIGACDHKFEGFGIFLGSTSHFSRSPPGTVAKVLNVLHNDLGLRLYRTSYEPDFSPEEDKYEINCTDPSSCAWVEIHKVASTLPDAKIFASIWSPPHYMKNKFYQLRPDYEAKYLHYIKNVTAVIKRDFNITIEKVSPVNEPENIFAPWDHTNMGPNQLCRIIKAYNDPLVSICPENSYFWVSRIYYNFKSLNRTLNCSSYCEIKATHAYALNLDFSSPNKLLAYYDLLPYPRRGTTNPIWQTEVSSTYHDARETQMQEALDLSRNIINFLATTCVQRYYFWLSYTYGASGESLIWGTANGDLELPKKYFAYKLFVNASNTINGPVDVSTCDDAVVDDLACVQFGEKERVIANTHLEDRATPNVCSVLCCTTETDDMTCSSNTNTVPARSICHCTLANPVLINNGILS